VSILNTDSQKILLQVRVQVMFGPHLASWNLMMNVSTLSSASSAIQYWSGSRKMGRVDWRRIWRRADRPQVATPSWQKLQALPLCGHQHYRQMWRVGWRSLFYACVLPT